VAHHGNELVVAHLHELLDGAHLVLLAGELDRGLHRGADGLFFDPREEALHDAELDVRLQ
jgi:hypothetical protein